MRRLLFTLTLLCAAVCAHAQSLIFKQRLAEQPAPERPFSAGRRCILPSTAMRAGRRCTCRAAPHFEDITGSVSSRTTGLRRATELCSQGAFRETYPDVKFTWIMKFLFHRFGGRIDQGGGYLMLKGRVASIPESLLKQLKKEKSPISNLLD